MAKRNIHSDELAVDTTDNELYRRNPDGTYTRITSNGAAHVTTAGAPAAVDTRIARFDAAADMPADITSNANVTADLVAMTTFTSTARKVQVIWHGGASTYAATAGAGPIATGAFVTFNAGDSATAATRLTYTDLTGAGTSTSGKTDTVQVSPDNPFVEITLSAALTDVYAIGIPVGVTPTSIVPSFLEVRVIG